MRGLIRSKQQGVDLEFAVSRCTRRSRSVAEMSQ